MNEKELRELLTMAIINNSNIEADEDDEILFTDVLDSVGSYKECNIPTMDEGIVIRFNNGKVAYITIHVI